MEQGNRELHPVAYAPIPKGIFKDEPTQEPSLEKDQVEGGEHFGKPLVTYPPLPQEVIKEEESHLEEGHERSNSGGIQVGNQDHDDVITCQESPEHYPLIVIGYIKEEPEFEEAEDDGCELVAYSPLQHGVIKEETAVGDVQDEFIPGVQIPQQEGTENLINEAVEDASIIVPFVNTSASGNENSTREPRAHQRNLIREGHRTSETISNSSRILRSRSKGEENSTMEDCVVEAKEQQYDERSEHSSLNGVISTDDDEDLVPNHSLAGPAKRKKKSGRKLSVEANPSQEKDKLPFKCANCGRRFKVEKYLKQHLARSCGTEPKFPCNECGHQFTRKAGLQIHLMKIHNVEKSQFATFGAAPDPRPMQPFLCEKCGRSYKNKCHLKRHMTYECDVEPSFFCPQCDYRASHKFDVKQHLINVHSGTGFSPARG